MSITETPARSGFAGGREGAGRHGSPDRVGALAAWAAVAFGAYLYAGRLGVLPLQAGNEAMYAAPPIFMMESGDYLVPRFLGANFLDKPPLCLWLIAASYRAFGISVATARLPAALVSLTTVLAVGIWTGRRRGGGAGLLAALVLMFTYSFWTFTRYFAADALFTLAVTLAVIALDAACRREGSDIRWGVLAGAALALAFLSKGLAGIVLPAGTVAAGLAWDRSRPLRAGRRGLIAVVILLALIAPWHWAMSERLGADFWRTFYLENQLLRGATTRYMRVLRGPLYYLPVIALAAFPWSLLLPQSLRRKRLSGLPLVWFLFGLVFWSVLVMKRDVYLMSLFPAIAILIAERIDREELRECPATRLAWIVAAAAIATALVLLASSSSLLAALVGRQTVILLGGGGVVMLAALLFAARSPRRFRAAVGVAFACGFFFLALERLDLSLAAYDPLPRWGDRVRRECAGGCDRFLVEVNTNSVEFYSRLSWKTVTEPGKLVGLARHRQGFLVMRSSLESSLAELPLRFEVLERKPWLPGNWASIAFRQKRPPLESLSLVRIEVPAVDKPREKTEGS